MSEGQRLIRILVVDDEEIVHASLRKILSRQGYRVDAVSTAAAALQLVERERFDLVISDLMMPETNGIELLHALRERDVRAPVLMITGYPTIRTAVQAMRLGAVDYLAKPFTRRELLAPVKRALKLEGDEDGAATPPRAVDPQSLVPGAAFYLPHHTWARLDEDGTFLVGIEETFLRAVGEVRGLRAPAEETMVEQGYVALRLDGPDGEHGAATPLSGLVLAVRHELVDRPALLGSGEWILRLRPSQLQTELELLVPRRY